MLKKLFERTDISRRGVLKGMAAVLTASAVAGCGGSSSDGSPVMNVPQNDLSFDRDIKTLFSSGSFNCGSRCLHKLHVKNGRILALTSAGDIPREGCRHYDENTGALLGEENQVQYRACARGYTYVQKIYQPDRLKYPLIQTGTKGEVSGFRRATWAEALKTAGKMFGEAYKRGKDELGYVPAGGRQWLYFYMNSMMTSANGGTDLPFIHFNNNESTGNAEAAKLDAVGNDAQSNNRMDRHNAKFILTWGQDNTSTTYYQVNGHWTDTKIRENTDVPIVVISSTYSDAAAMLANGTEATYKEWLTTDTTEPKGGSVTTTIPSWIACRPATDGALMVAMMYVIYKRNLYDHEFLEKKCYGFFKNQIVTSSGPKHTPSYDPASYQPFNGINRAGNPVVFPSAFTDNKSDTYNPLDSFNGAEFKVADGDSFEEYLLKREEDWGSAAGDYAGVLEYVSRLTGVKPAVIEALAIKFSTWAKKESWASPGVPEAALLAAGGGPQRAYNGMEWTWLCICLCAMCGYSDRPGGGPGFSMYTMPDDMIYSDNMAGGFGRSACSTNPYAGNHVEMNISALGEILMKGSDWRSPYRIIEDVKRTTMKYDGTYVDLEPRWLAGKKLLEIDLLVVDHANFIVSQANSNKLAKAFKENLKYLIVADLHMTPTAALADVVFPIASDYEYESFGEPYIVGPSARFYHAKAIDPMYETRTEDDFRNALWNAANAETGLQLPSYMSFGAPIQQKGYEDITPSDMYKKYVDANAAMPTWDELATKKGFVDLTIPKNKSIVGFRDITIPSDTYSPETYMDTSTGRINFHSPFWKLRMEDYDLDPGRLPDVGCRSSTAKYVPNREGYEKFFSDDKLTKFTGFYSADSKRTYKLLYLANKPRYRAQTVFDNVVMMKDQVKHHGVRINVNDANERGVKNGDLVYVYNDRGVLKVRAEVSNRLPPGVISVEHGVWHRPSKLAEERADVWIRHFDGTVEKVSLPVDVGGCANTLTDDCFTLDPVYLCQTLAAQGGPCEVSLKNPGIQA